MKKRILSMLLALCLCFALLPVAAFADDGDLTEETAAVKAEKDGSISYFANLDECLQDSTWWDSITILKDTYYGSYWAINECHEFIVNPGATLTIESLMYLGNNDESSCAVYGGGTIAGGADSFFGFGPGVTVSAITVDCTTIINGGGTIESGTFKGDVLSFGTITGGVFEGNVVNTSDAEKTHHIYQVTYEVTEGTITGGTFEGTVTNGGAYEEADVTGTSTISGGTFNGDVINIEDGAIIGGTFNKTVTNQSGATINNADNAIRLGGSCTVTNDGKVRCNNNHIRNENNICRLCGDGMVTGTRHIHRVCCKDDCTIIGHDSNQEWNRPANPLPIMAGFFYLTEDKTIDETWTPANGAHLCLNGHSITTTGDGPTITIDPGVTFSLTDCDDTGTVDSVLISGGEAYIYGGSVGSLTVEAGSAQLQGGSFGSITVTGWGTTCADLLAEGYVYYEKSTTATGVCYTVVDGNVKEITGNIMVAPGTATDDSSEPSIILTPDPTYDINVSDTIGGSVEVSPSCAERGEIVTVTVTAQVGYLLDTLTVLDQDGDEVKLAHKAGGKYTFKMPKGDATVTATFMEYISTLFTFADVTADQYYYDAVLWAAENAITGGVGGNNFGPDLNCTRAQLVTFLWRAAGCPVVDYAMSFADVDETAYYGEAVCWAASLGIVGGYGNGLFGTEDHITREQVAAILYRYAGAMGQDVSLGEDTNILSYNDAFEVSEYAVSAFQWATGAGIVQGSNGSLMPQANCTRAQIVTMLYRVQDLGSRG